MSASAILSNRPRTGRQAHISDPDVTEENQFGFGFVMSAQQPPGYNRAPTYSGAFDESDVPNMEFDEVSPVSADYRDVPDETPLQRKSKEMGRQASGGSDVIENPNYGGSPEQGEYGDDGDLINMSANSRRFFNKVRHVIDDLPSARREFYNLVETAAKFNQKVDQEEVARLMQGETSIHKQRATPDTITKQDSLQMTFDAIVDQDVHQATDMLDLVKEQDSRMSIKLERARKLNSHIREKKQAIGRIQLWWLLTRQKFASYMSKTLYALDNSSLWHSDIKTLEGKHGAHVGIYFKFMRWCLLLNLVIAVMVCGFVVIPYATLYGFSNNDDVIHGDTGYSPTAGETILGLFNGGGAFNASAYFMGVYYLPYAAPYDINTTASVWVPEGASDPHVETYDIPLAYLLTTGGYMLLSFILIFNGVYDAIQKSVFGYGIHHGERLSSMVFCRFDHSLTHPKSLELHKASTAREIKEVLGETTAKAIYQKRLSEKWKTIWLKRVLVNLFMLGMLLLSLLAIFATVTRFSDGNEGERVVPAIVLALINATIPLMFEILAEFEEWRTQLQVIKLTILRSVVLRFVGLYVFIYAAYRRKDDYACWESFLGQEAYTVFIIGSLLFEIFTSTLIDIWITIAHKHLPCVRVVLKDPAYFDAIKKTLELTYAQAVIWLGTYFSPLLPLAGMARIVTLFYLQKWSTMTWCKPKGLPFLSQHSLPKLIWSLFLVSIVLVAIPLGYVIPRASSSGVFMPASWQDRFTGNLTGTLGSCSGEDVVESCTVCLDSSFSSSEEVCWRPLPGDGRYPNGVKVTVGNLCASCPKGCGPFRNQRSAYEILDFEYNEWPDGAQDFVDFLGTASFTVILAFALLSCCLVNHARASATAKWAKKVEIERNMERWDKRWILEKYAITFEEEKFDEYKDPALDESGYNGGHLQTASHNTSLPGDAGYLNESTRPSPRAQRRRQDLKMARV